MVARAPSDSASVPTHITNRFWFYELFAIDAVWIEPALPRARMIRAFRRLPC